MATGEVIAHFDDDDYYGPNYLSAMAGQLGDAGLVRLAGWFIYSQAQSRLWYWDQRTIAEPIHYRLMGGRNLDAVPVAKLNAEDQETWVNDNLSGWGFSFMYPKAVYDKVQFEEVNHGEEGLFTQGVRKLGYDVIQAVKGCSHRNAATEFKRLGDTYGDRYAICIPANFADSQGRFDPNRQTPVADAQNIIKIILLLPGEQAARIRMKASEVFVRFLVRPGLT